MRIKLSFAFAIAIASSAFLPVMAQNITAQKLEFGGQVSEYETAATKSDQSMPCADCSNEFIKGEGKASADIINKLPNTGNAQQKYVRPDAGKRFKKYLNSVVGPTAFIGPVISAGFNQWRDRPEEWENNAKGFARRLGSSLGKNAIRQTVTYGLDEAFKLDSNFYKSGKKKFGDRLGNALLSSVTARNKQGKRVIGVPGIVGSYTSSVIAVEAWYPKRFDYKEGLRQGTISVFTRMGVNIMREFFFKN